MARVARPERGASAGWRRARAGAWHAGAVLALAGCGCPGFTTSMAEFDSVAGWRPAQAEPDVVDYSEDAERMPLPLRVLEGSGLDVALSGLLGIEPSTSKISSPSAFARERMLCFAEDAVGDMHRTALAAARLSWVLDGDRHALNQITALRGLQVLAQALGLDPLAVDLGPLPDKSDEATVAAWQPHIETLRVCATEIAAGRRLSATLAATCDQALQQGRDVAPPAPRDRRAQLLLLNYLAHRASEGALRQHAGATLDIVLRRTAADSLRRALFEPRSPEVRDAAIRVCCGLGGNAAVARILRSVATPQADGRAVVGRNDLDRGVRLTLVRLCGQLPPEDALRAEPGGPAPVEFLYDVISDFGADRALHVAALEALACCLRRPVSFDRAWADAWWSDYVVNRGVDRGARP